MRGATRGRVLAWPGALDTPTEVCWQLGHVDPSVAEQRVPRTGPIPFEALLVAVPGGARVEGPFVLPDTHPCGRTRQQRCITFYAKKQGVGHL